MRRQGWSLMLPDLATVAYVTGAVAISSAFVSPTYSRAYYHHFGHRHDCYRHHGLAGQRFVFCGLWWCQTAVRPARARMWRSRTESLSYHERNRNSVGLG